MRSFLALPAFLLAFPAFAVEVPSQADFDALDARVEALEQLHAPPVDNPPTVTNLGASCNEGQACPGNVGAADDSGSFTVTWGATPLTGFAGQADGSWVAAPVDGDGLAMYGVTGEVSDGVNAPVPFTLQITVNDTVTPPPPQGGMVTCTDLNDCTTKLAAQGGGWGEIPGSIASVYPTPPSGPWCGSPGGILGSWNGAAFDPVNNLLYFHGGGHGDWCGNGVYEFDLETGSWERIYNPDALTFLAVHSTNPLRYCWVPDLRQVPGSTHTYDGLQFSTQTGTFFHFRGFWAQGSNCFDNGTAWTIDPTDPRIIPPADADDAATYEFNPSRTETRNGLAPLTWRRLFNHMGSVNARLPRSVELGDGQLLLGSNARLYAFDPVTGTLGNQVQFLGDQGYGTAVYWNGLVFSALNNLRVLDLATGSTLPAIGAPDGDDHGLTVDADGVLYLWDGLHTIYTLDYAAGETIWTTHDWSAGGPQVTGGQSVLSKFQYVPSHDVIVAYATDQTGVFIYMHPGSGQVGEGEPDPEAPTFAGHVVAPQLVTLPVWNEPMALQPEAPDLATRCPGSWGELTFTPAMDFGASSGLTSNAVGTGTPNIRFLLEPGDYFESLRPQDAQCIEVVGKAPGVVLHEGYRLRPKTGPTSGGAVLTRNVTFADGAYVIGDGVMAFHNVTQRSRRSAWGTASASATPYYLEYVNSTLGPDLGWHGVYLERSCGQLVLMGNTIYGGSPSKHAFKSVCALSRIEGNVFSNVGLDGQPLGQNNNSLDIIALYPLDGPYACGQSIVRDNVFLFRTTQNNARMFHSYRSRGDWGGCNRGELVNGAYTYLHPESPEYVDPALWVDIASRLAKFDQGFQQAYDDPWLFAHLTEGNTYIEFRDSGGMTPPSRLYSLRPAAGPTTTSALNAEADELKGLYTDDEAAWRAEASDELEYVHDQVPPIWQRDIRRTGRSSMPHTPPIAAPQGWVERYGVFVGPETYVTCSLDGQTCSEVDPEPQPYIEPDPDDALFTAHPPRVIPLS